MRTVEFAGEAFDEFADWARTDKKLYQRIVRLVTECRRTPFEGIGKPEPLKANLKGLWSRRISDEHRLVYKVTDERIVIHSLQGHYED